MKVNATKTGNPAGHQEIEHTADRELEVWAPDMPGLLEQAALGMYAIAGIRLQDQPRVTRSITLKAPDAEELLVSFLTELLFMAEDENLGFDQMHLSLKSDTLKAELSGAPISSQNKEIKAVTFHNLKVKQSDKGLETRIVFDV